MNLVDKIILENRYDVTNQRFLGLHYKGLKSTYFPVLYHVTPLYLYEENIKQEGLKANLPEKNFRYGDEKFGIHLFEDKYEAENLALQLWSSLGERKNKKTKGQYVLLKVNMKKAPKSILKIDNLYGNGYVYKGNNIPSNCIEFVKTIDVLKHRQNRKDPTFIKNNKKIEKERDIERWDNLFKKLTQKDKNFLNQLKNKDIDIYKLSNEERNQLYKLKYLFTNKNQTYKLKTAIKERL